MSTDTKDSANWTIGRRTLLGTGAAAAGLGLVAGIVKPGNAAPLREAKVPTQFRGKHPVTLQPDWVALPDGDGDGVRIADDIDVIIDGDTIQEVRPRAKRAPNHTVSLPGQLLTPGFIAGHRHSCGDVITRGISESKLGDGAFKDLQRPYTLLDELNDDDLEAIVGFGIAEQLRGGATTHLEMSLSLRQAKAVVAVVGRWGARSYPSVQVPGQSRVNQIWQRKDDKVLFESEQDTIQEISQALAYLQTVANSEDGRIRPMMAGHATDTHTENTINVLLKAAIELGNGLHMHVSSNKLEDTRIRALWGGLSPIQWLDSLGVFDAGIPIFGAHLTAWTPETDAKLLASKSAFTYSHCPSATTGGQQPWPEALAAGVNSCLGYDGRGGDYVEKIKQAVQFGQLRALGKGPVAMVSPIVLDSIAAGTVRPANGLGRSDLGRISAGAKADLTSVFVDGPHLGLAGPAPENGLLYASGRDVQLVLVDGEPKVAGGSLVVADQREVDARAHRAVAKVWAQLHSEGWL